MDIDNFLRNRRTCHQFLNKEVPNALIEKAITTSIWVPNHHLTFPWQYWVLGERVKQQFTEIVYEYIATTFSPTAADNKVSRIKTIPTIIVIAGLQDPNPQKCQENNATVFCGIHNLSLSLWNEGIGSKWVTNAFIHLTAIKDLLHVPKSYSILSMLYCGYPQKIPSQSRPKINQFVTYTE